MEGFEDNLRQLIEEAVNKALSNQERAVNLPQAPNLPAYLDANDAAHLIGCSRSHFLKMARARNLPRHSYDSPKVITYSRADVLDMAASCRIEV